MASETIEMCGHTAEDGTLNLSLKLGIPDADFSVLVQVTPLPPKEEVDEYGWPIGFFEEVAGSMPELERAPQGTLKAGWSLNDLPRRYERLHCFPAQTQSEAN